MKRLSFSLLGLVILCLGTATFIEHYQGTDVTHKYIYGSSWFVFLWGMLLISALTYCVQRKFHKTASVFLLHSSFIIILVGAFVTSLTSQRGILHLRKGENVNMFLLENQTGERYEKIPFTVSLDTFIVENYSGTQAPSDYISHITIKHKEVTTHKIVSMNNIVEYDGFRFYQSSFDPDKQGVYLSVNRDPWGIPLTYTGYFLLFFSMLFTLVSPKGGFRKLLKHPLLQKTACVILLLIWGVQLKADPSVLMKEQIAQLSDVQVLYNNRITPLQTLARDFALKLTGKDKYGNYTAEQIFTGWLFYPNEWEKEPMIEVKNAELRSKLDLREKSSFLDFFDFSGIYKLEVYWDLLHQGGQQSALLKEVIALDEKIQLIVMLRRGALLQVFPYKYKGITEWYSPISPLPKEANPSVRLFFSKTFSLLYEAVANNDKALFQKIVLKIKKYQFKNGGVSALSSGQIKAEFWYNRLLIADILYKVNLTVGLLAFIFFICTNSQSRKYMWVYFFTMLQLAISFVLLTLNIALRTYICERFPLSNGYETMIFLAWCIHLSVFLFRKRFLLIPASALLLSGFCLLVASIGSMNPKITPLMPVLASPLLSLHVSTIMMSYALFGFTFFNAVAALIQLALHTKGGVENESITRLTLLSKLFLYPALTFLGIGIFIGAIWANVSWGRYWAWDPKEVWALISFLIYSIALHADSIRILQRPLFFHLFMLIAFLSILMTYFGVNFFLGGMHSYA